jgi:hypothetical protein
VRSKWESRALRLYQEKRALEGSKAWFGKRSRVSFGSKCVSWLCSPHSSSKKEHVQNVSPQVIGFDILRLKIQNLLKLVI